jgi:hypothetical protein
LMVRSRTLLAPRAPKPDGANSKMADHETTRGRSNVHHSSSTSTSLQDANNNSHRSQKKLND